MKSTRSLPPRWRVERAGSPGAWLPGWFVRSPDGLTSYHCPTWANALDIAMVNLELEVCS